MKNKKSIIIFFSLILIILVISIVKSNSTENMNSIATTSSAVESNKKIGWGIKRSDNHEQPDLGTENKKLVEENGDIAMGNSTDKYVYLTFDMGYEAGYTSSILDTLKENEVKAAFFITGHYLNSASDLVKRMVDEGHIIGNHTVNHHSMPDISEEEIKKEVTTLHTTMYEKFGYEMKYLRPPKGEYSQKTLRITKELGYTSVMWSLAYDDWDKNKQGREEYGKSKILDNIHPGAVILLHATSKDNMNILDEIIKKVKEMGYEFKTLDEFKK